MELDAFTILSLAVSGGAITVGLMAFLVSSSLRGSVDSLVTQFREMKQTVGTTGSELHEIRAQMTMEEKIRDNNYRVGHDELVAQVTNMKLGNEMDTKITTERHRTNILETMQDHLNDHAQGAVKPLA